MQLRREALLGIYSLVVVHIVTAFGAIGLLSRMSPAVENILEENVYSNEAAERILATLALADPTPATVMRERFDSNLQRLRNNITEAEETPVIDEIERALAEVVNGELPAREEAVRGLLKLISINREAMVKADEDAKRLGTAGAWAAVFLALVGFACSVVVVSGIRQRILSPVEDLSATLEAARHGDLHRRCKKWSSPAEVRTALTEVNKLLDERLERMAVAQAESNAGRIIALHLMERSEAPTFVLGSQGEIVLANQKALERLSRDEGGRLRRHLRELTKTESGTENFRVRRIDRHDLWWVEVG